MSGPTETPLLLTWYGNDLFCTHDMGSASASGPRFIQLIVRLEALCGVEFVAVSELAKHLAR
jgi:hypothetical protein